MTTIKQIVAARLDGESEAFLSDIAAHGIHNITNAYQGDSEEEYALYSEEFDAQSKQLLAQIEDQRIAEFRNPQESP